MLIKLYFLTDTDFQLAVAVFFLLLRIFYCKVKQLLRNDPVTVSNIIHEVLS
jgi:hypothetical protein